MGNSHTKEARPDQAGPPGHDVQGHPADPAASGRSADHAERQRNRQSRFRNPDLAILGISSGPQSREEPPYERRETRQEREARRLERERVAREKERERSMREEHVDGGYLVTLGTYTGPEDFSKPTVRQLQIERKIAPFWRGLDDKDDSWTEYQLVCAGRGLPIPAADEQPPDEFLPKPQSPNASSQNLNNLTVPMGPRTLSTGSNGSGEPGSALASPTGTDQKRSNSPFKPRAKALAAALSMGSRNNSSTDMGPREINLPHDPFVNGQPLEVFLYKDAAECPICFMYYPPYLNRTRCCDQSICSECFVQIKRADPHFPEHHTDEAPDEETRDPEMLISEPATCPYCQQTEFGVTFEPPPFRRGLAYTMPPLSSQNTAMSSRSSLNSTLSPSSPPAGRRRTQSLSANAPNVITTDRVRPDWSSKLAAQRAHQARRAAAATALHTAAFLIGNENQSRGFGFSRPGRFSRRNTGQGASGTGDASPAGEQEGESPTGPEPGPRGSSGRAGNGAAGSRRNRMDELEDMMFMEAVRLSIAAEEERQRKQEKVERKEAKKREKEERKAAKKAEKQSGFYGGPSSASGSSLSLGLGRRRGNSAASHLRNETTLQSAASTSTSAATDAGPRSGPTSAAASGTASPTETTENKGKGVERTSPPATGDSEGEARGSTPAGSSSPNTLPISAASRGPSHLRQMSNASSISSSVCGDSAPGSYSNQGGYLDAGNPRASDTSVGGRNDEADRDAEEPMFNFRSLAEMVGVDIENGESTDQQTGDHSAGGADRKTEKKADDDEVPRAEQVEDTTSPTAIEDSVATLKPSLRSNSPPTIPEATPEEEGVNDKAVGGGSNPGKPDNMAPQGALNVPIPPPELTITPETPAPMEGTEADSKQLGSHNVMERSAYITQ